MSEADVRQQVQMGARFVMFRWAVSVIVMSFRRTSPIYFVRAGENPVATASAAIRNGVGAGTKNPKTVSTRHGPISQK